MAGGLTRFRDDLLAWYDAEKRDLPWRADNSPYRVWVSEVMLQQTTVAAVVPYFERWMERFPTVGSLASADIEDALSVWQGLGYYRRCRNLHASAKRVVVDGWPSDYRSWLALPGVGAYTAGAICSISLGLQTPAVDGNVERVYSRFHADGSFDLKPKAAAWVKELVMHGRPGDVTQALMELGATVCKPTAPTCDLCPVSRACKARMTDTQDGLPKRKAKREQVELNHAVCVPYFEGRYGVRKIKQGEWWEGLYEFPRGSDYEALLRTIGKGEPSMLGQFKHTVTRHRITVDAVLVLTEAAQDDLEWHTPESLESLPMPSPQRKVARMAVAAVEGQRGRNSTGVASVPSSAKK